jgi:hypothetical protein
MIATTLTQRGSRRPHGLQWYAASVQALIPGKKYQERSRRFMAGLSSQACAVEQNVWRFSWIMEAR